MRLNTIDHVLISLKEHTKAGRFSFPNKNVSAVASRHDKIVAPKVCFLDHSPKETRVTHEATAAHENIIRAYYIQPILVCFRGFALLRTRLVFHCHAGYTRLTIRTYITYEPNKTKSVTSIHQEGTVFFSTQIEQNYDSRWITVEPKNFSTFGSASSLDRPVRSKYLIL